MEPSRKLVKKVLPWFKNKYLLTFLIFLVWLVFFDQNNLLDRARQLHRQDELMQEKAFYTKKIKADSVKLHQLKTDRKSVV